MPENADWDIVSGVGVTALGAAAARAIETLHDKPLVTDPYAAAFVRAANGQLPKPMPVTPQDAAADPAMPYFEIAHYMGVRSRFIDEFFGDASGDDIRQVVILAAGLDTRAYRLHWPPGTTLYEIDAPQVLAFKNAVLSDAGAQVRCDRRAIAADLRENWANTLGQAGFDPAIPTAWLTEGLFMYLPDDAIDALLGQVHKLSADGSRFAAENMLIGAEAMRDAGAQAVAERVDTDITEVWASEKRLDPAGWLRTRGWTVSADTAATLADGYGRPMSATSVDLLLRSALITAIRDRTANEG